MPQWNYSVKLQDESKVAKAVIREVPVHPKVIVEIANAINGMNLKKAERFLENVIKQKEPLPFRRSNKKVSHRRGLSDRWGVPSGRYPIKAATYVLNLLRNVENNADNKGLEIDKLVIYHIGVSKGLTLKRAMPRAFGRADILRKFRSNIEIIVRMEG